MSAQPHQRLIQPPYSVEGLLKGFSCGLGPRVPHRYSQEMTHVFSYADSVISSQVKNLFCVFSVGCIYNFFFKIVLPGFESSLHIPGGCVVCNVHTFITSSTL